MEFKNSKKRLEGEERTRSFKEKAKSKNKNYQSFTALDYNFLSIQGQLLAYIFITFPENCDSKFVVISLDIMTRNF